MSVSISINNVDIACSVSHRESIIGASVGMLVTLVELGLHSGVTTAISLTLNTGEGIIISDVMDRLGLGVVVALCCCGGGCGCCCCSLGRSICKGCETRLLHESVLATTGSSILTLGASSGIKKLLLILTGGEGGGDN